MNFDAVRGENEYLLILRINTCHDEQTNKRTGDTAALPPTSVSLAVRVVAMATVPLLVSTGILVRRTLWACKHNGIQYDRAAELRCREKTMPVSVALPVRDYC